MALKNYTTSISIEKTIMEIEQILARFGASHIHKIYLKEIPIGLAFQIEIDGNPLSFKLPMREDKIKEVFRKQVNEGNLPKRYWDDMEQARKTGWRIIKDWIDSQVALMEIEMVKFQEVFLPYMYNEKMGKTLFELLEKQNFDLQLDYKEDDKIGEKKEN